MGFLAADLSPIRLSDSDHALASPRLAVGLGIEDLKYVYELDPNFAPFPTYPLVIGSKGDSFGGFDMDGNEG